jgi:hypothetical protein
MRCGIAGPHEHGDAAAPQGGVGFGRDHPGEVDLGRAAERLGELHRARSLDQSDAHALRPLVAERDAEREGHQQREGEGPEHRLGLAQEPQHARTGQLPECDVAQASPAPRRSRDRSGPIRHRAASGR